MNSRRVRRGEIHWVDWSPSRGSEQTGRRPALIVQTDAGNSNPTYPNTIVAAISTTPARVLTHVELLPTTENGLSAISCVKCEQLITISKDRLAGRVGQVGEIEMQRVDEALKRALAIQ